MTASAIGVMQTISDLEIGGAQEVVHTLAKYLTASDGCQTVVCTFRDGPLRQDIEQLGVKVEVLPPRRYSVVASPLFIADMIRLWKHLARLVREYQVDVIQTRLLRSPDSLVLSLLYTARLRAVLWTFHSASFELTAGEPPKHKWLLAPRKAVHRRLYRWSSHLVSGFVAVSDQVGQSIADVIGPAAAKIHVICNGMVQVVTRRAAKGHGCTGEAMHRRVSA